MAGRSLSPSACSSKARCTIAAGQVAVEADAAAHHVVARPGERDCRRGVGRVHQRCLIPGRGELGHQVVEEVELGLGVGAVRFRPRRRPRAGASTRPRAGGPARAIDQLRQRHEVLGRRTDPVHAGVDLQVDRHLVARARATSGEGVDGLARVQRRGEPVGERGLDGLGPALAQQEDGRGDAVLAQLHPLVDQRHRQPLGAAGERGAGDRRTAVAVAVGLHHGAQLGGRGQASQHPGVVRHRGEVDLRPRRPRATLGHRHLRVRGVTDAVGVGEGHAPPAPARRQPRVPRRRCVDATTRTPPPVPGRSPPPDPRPDRARPPARARAPPARPPRAPRRPGPRRRR